MVEEVGGDGLRGCKLQAKDRVAIMSSMSAMESSSSTQAGVQTAAASSSGSRLRRSSLFCEASPTSFRFWRGWEMQRLKLRATPRLLQARPLAPGP